MRVLPNLILVTTLAYAVLLVVWVGWMRREDTKVLKLHHLMTALLVVQTVRKTAFIVSISVFGCIWSLVTAGLAFFRYIAFRASFRMIRLLYTGRH
jgi:hypothetical protein